MINEIIARMSRCTDDTNNVVGESTHSIYTQTVYVYRKKSNSSDTKTKVS